MAEQRVKVKRLKNGSIHQLELSHALNLLRLQSGTAKGWELSDDKYIFENNEISRRKRDNKDLSKSEE